MAKRFLSKAEAAEYLAQETGKVPLRLMSRADVAEYLGVKTDSINGYRDLEPDVMIGVHKGYFPETIDRFRVKHPARATWVNRGSQEVDQLDLGLSPPDSE